MRWQRMGPSLRRLGLKRMRRARWKTRKSRRKRKRKR